MNLAVLNVHPTGYVKPVKVLTEVFLGVKCLAAVGKSDLVSEIFDGGAAMVVGLESADGLGNCSTDIDRAPLAGTARLRCEERGARGQRPGLGREDNPPATSGTMHESLSLGTLVLDMQRTQQIHDIRKREYLAPQWRWLTGTPFGVSSRCGHAAKPIDLRRPGFPRSVRDMGSGDSHVNGPLGCRMPLTVVS
ncbi:hypothetical protein [Mycolicibacterium fortuitum]|uniref:hypothetical protein n=1 Tax=Mycolicibacterium fortuitum TaxID=1766 RepID=UPI001CDBF2D5|nr:hypothetical protein [Mycolicibacterium fortuitum]UBV17763.1 hypothetical protein H8Z57_13825 [Mycolicibacterium fortuitum]